MSKQFKSGQKVPASGQYAEVGPRGGITKHEVTCVKGEPFPPTRKPNSTFTMVDPTNNRSGKRK